MIRLRFETQNTKENNEDFALTPYLFLVGASCSGLWAYGFGFCWGWRAVCICVVNYSIEKDR